jgi:MoaA/NifB/PqqE/SkfB family radical SAM enzyme
MKIKSIKKENKIVNTYNIGVRDNNNYYVEDVLVHNCYTNALADGENYEDICETWKKWMATFPEDKDLEAGSITEKPFQVAIGSTGEPTIHPQFPEFLKTVYESGVVPNYTTNGIVLASNTDWSKRVMEATKNFCGAVAVSFGNKIIRTNAKKAIEKLIKDGEVKVAIHHLISDKNSVDELIKIALDYGSDIHYHVLLPLMKHGRSTEEMEGQETFDYLEDLLIKNNVKNVAFGANFSPYLNKSKIHTWNYPPESLSENVILKKDKVIITPSSFNLKPCKIIKL